MRGLRFQAKYFKRDKSKSYYIFFNFEQLGGWEHPTIARNMGLFGTRGTRGDKGTRGQGGSIPVF